MSNVIACTEHACKAVEGNRWYQATSHGHTLGISLPDAGRSLSVKVVTRGGDRTLLLVDEDGEPLEVDTKYGPSQVAMVLGQ